MPLTANWLGRDDLERISEVRMRAFTTPADRDKMIVRTQSDRFDDGDVLVLSQDGMDVATATSLSLKINVRGTVLPCQGVAWVGTVRTHRRRRVDGHGLASTVLKALRQKAIERGEIVSMLAPFRVSFYERFGFSVVERQATWTIPLSVLPDGQTDGFREYAPADAGNAVAGRQRQFMATHGDVETNERSLSYWLTELRDIGFRFIDGDGKNVRSQFTLGTEVSAGQTIAVVHRPWWDSPAALRDLLAMLGTLKDQYSAARITLPADLPINWLLKEKQVPHRRVDHPAAVCTLTTRMQAAVLDVPKFFEALRPPAKTYGPVTVAVKSRDRVATWLLDFASGAVSATASTESPDVELDELAFTAMAFGDLTAGDAAAIGQLRVLSPAALPLLESLAAGPKPYCHEYF